MIKKILSVLVSVILLCSIGTFVMAAETAQTIIYTIDEAMIDEANPDTVARPVPMSGYSYLKGGTDNEDAENTDPDIRLVLHKFDISMYAYPVDSALVTYYYRDTAPSGSGWGDGNIMVFKAPANWDSDTVTWNTFNADSPYDHTKNGVNYLANGNGAGANNSTSSESVNITSAVNDALLAGETELALAYARDVKRGEDGLTANRKNEMRMIVDKTFVKITQSEPVHKNEGTVESVIFCDRTLISDEYPDIPQTFNAKRGFYYASSGSSVGISNNVDNADPYGVSRSNYIKFDLNGIDLSRPIKKVTISYGASLNARTWTVCHYLVDNDDWTGGKGTGTMGREIVWNDVFPKNAETGEVEPTKYAPNREKLAYSTDPKIVSSNSHDNGIMQGPFDITSIVKPELEAENFDGKISIAVMVRDCSAGIRATRIIFNNPAEGTVEYTANKELYGPYLNIIYDDGGEVASAKENISFKVNDAEAATLSSGVFTASTEITNTMLEDTKAALLMCVYEGNKLKEIFVKPALVNNRNKNAGKTTISVSSGKEIEAGENTKVGIYLWKDLLFPIPVNEGKVITQ